MGKLRAVASLTVPGGQENHFPHFFLKFRSIFLIFPQTLLIFFLILTLRVGKSPTREGPGYATGRKLVGRKRMKEDRERERGLGDKQWSNHCGSRGGAECPLTAKKLPKIREKKGKIGKNRKGKGLSLPSPDK